MATRSRPKGKTPTQKKPSDKLLPRLTVFFFRHIRMTAVIWLVVTVFGLISYTTLLQREGFPSINLPLAIVSGTYFVNDPAKVDQDAVRLVSELALKQGNATTVQSQSADNFFTVSIQYKEGTDAKAAAASLEQAVKDSGQLPASAQIKYNVPYFGVTGGDARKIDAALSFYDKNTPDASAEELTAKANQAVQWLNDQHLSHVKDVFVKDPFQQVTDPLTGQAVTVQRSFDRYGEREGDHIHYYSSVLIGIEAVPGTDVIKLDDQIREAVGRLGQQEGFQDYGTSVSASFAPNIKENIGELQRVLLEGLLAILVVGSIVIAIRASLITVVSMVTVLLVSLGLLYLIGYTLNVITLFALILALALIVDDTIIMVEAIDVARHRTKDRVHAVREASSKISRAMMAATATAALSFAPLLFVGGVLGSFIRAIPVTIISALIISLFVSLIFIPFFARFLLLGEKQMGKKGVTEVAAGLEAAVASFIARPMLWARGSQTKLITVGTTAMFIGLGFIIGGVIIARDVVFNIFPPTKDTNGLVLSMSFPPGTHIEDAEAIASRADDIAAEIVGPNYERGSYFDTATAQAANEQITLTSYSKRDITSPQLVKNLQDRFDKDFHDAKVAVGQMDIGPPATSFVVQIKADNRQASLDAANDLASYLSTLELKRTNGNTAHLVNVSASSPDQFIRDDGQPIVTVSAGFDASDTTTLVGLAQTAVSERMTKEKLASYNLSQDAVRFDLGQEEENQESFRTLVLAFPVLLMVMYVLLAIEFRSLLQPLLIFMAIPFSIFGVMLGLRLTNNAISFFTLLGFFALVGLSIKNTILLTDFANQSRRAGHGAIDSAVAALRERFRPLFATSMTAVVSLIPLALASPFWEGLAVVLIFGLLSSTFLVVCVFPYYYLGAEFLRGAISRRGFVLWAVATAGVVYAVWQLVGIAYGLLVIPCSLMLVLLQGFYHRRLVR
jgi:multidrug efflux pump subunit AcrB